jgi:hypothetical protein
LGLNDKNSRSELSKKLGKYFNNNFLKLPENIFKRSHRKNEHKKKQRHNIK